MITGYTRTRIGNTTLVTAASSLSGVVYFFWYLDGAYVGFGASPTRSFTVEPDDQSEVVALDSNDPAFDPIANAPAGYPARRSLVWVRSLDADVYQYRVEQRLNSGAWSVLGYEKDIPSQWLYRFISPRLDDLSNYEWRIVPMDLAGNDGTPIVMPVEKIVRRPDAPRFSVELQPSTEVLFEAA